MDNGQWPKWGGGHRGQIVVRTSLAGLHVNTGIIQIVLDIFNFPKINLPSVLVTPVLNIAKKNVATVKNGKGCPKVGQKGSNLGNASKTSVFFRWCLPPKTRVILHSHVVVNYFSEFSQLLVIKRDGTFAELTHRKTKLFHTKFLFLG